MRIFFRDTSNSEKVILMIKGAENEISKLLKENESQFVNYKCKEISKIGLRTLTFC